MISQIECIVPTCHQLFDVQVENIPVGGINISTNMSGTMCCPGCIAEREAYEARLDDFGYLIKTK